MRARGETSSKMDFKTISKVFCPVRSYSNWREAERLVVWSSGELSQVPSLFLEDMSIDEFTSLLHRSLPSAHMEEVQRMPEIEGLVLLEFLKRLNDN